MLRFAALVGCAYGMQQSPVSHVVTVLQEMKAELEAEAAADAETSKKMGCWCDDTTRELTDKIAKATQEIDTTDAAIKTATARIATLETEIAQLEKSIKEDQETLKESTSIRTKANAEFQQAEKDLMMGISGLNGAITVLKKHQTAFLQMHPENLQKVASVLQKVTQYSALTESITPSQMKVLNTFVQQPTFNAYSSQSGQIFGILEQMLETFESDLKNARETETTESANFAASKKALEEGIAGATAMKNDKETNLADTKSALAAGTAALADLQEQKAADEELLDTTTQKCQAFNTEGATRAAERATELTAVNEAIGILNSDESAALFRDTFTSFVQVKSSDARQKASQVLLAAARKSKNPALTVLAQDVKAAAFEKVFEAIAQLVTDLKAQMADDVAQKDACIDAKNLLASVIMKTARDKKDLESKIEHLEQVIATLTEDIANLEADIKETNDALATAGSNREAENKEFQKVAADQTASIATLQKALTVLKQVYATATPAQAAFLQGDPASEEQSFERYDKNEKGGSVLGLISSIIADAKQAKALAIQAEADSQKAYETIVKQSNQAIKAAEDTKTEKTTEKADKESALSERNAELATTDATLTSKTDEKAAKDDECAFLLTNFDVRQDHMTSEIEALNQAEAYLRNMK